MFSFFYLLINGRKIQYLKQLESDKTISSSVAIIIAIRNEEADIKDALTSVCNLDYSNLKIIVVNDRSTDDTAEILAALNKKFPFQLITITELLVKPFSTEYLIKSYSSYWAFAGKS